MHNRGMVMSVNLEYYRIFYTVAKKGSFTAAANTLMTSQPALSRSVKLLEQELGCELFRRTSRGVRLTSEGSQLLLYVDRAYEEIMQAELLMGRLKEFNEGQIKIAASATALVSGLLEKIGAFREIYPNVKLNIVNHNSYSSLKRLRDSEVDFAISSSAISVPPDVKGIKLDSIRDVLLGGERFRHLGDRSISLKEVSKQPMVAVTEGTAIRTFYNRLFIKHRCVFAPEIEVTSVGLLLPMIKNNLGLGFVPEVYTSLFSSEGLTRIKVTDLIPEREIWLYYRDDGTLSIAAQRFRDYLADGKLS